MLHRLADSLKPGHIDTKVINNHMFFFSGESPLSNFFNPAKFTVEGVEYVNSEQYILKKTKFCQKPLMWLKQLCKNLIAEK